MSDAGGPSRVLPVGFVPCAPLLVPAVAGGSAREDDSLRAACAQVVARLIAGHPGRVTVVAPASPAGERSPDATWDFLGFGVPRHGHGGRDVLPWQLGIGAWLLDAAGWDGARRYLAIDDDLADGDPAVGELAVDGAAVLIVGDGSACRSDRAPGHLDDRAEAFDAGIAASLAGGDVAGLAEIDPALAAELMCAGAPAWRWLGRALVGHPVTRAELLIHTAPYGVGYFVAEWSVG